jgi:hypothetical protein
MRVALTHELQDKSCHDPVQSGLGDLPRRFAEAAECWRRLLVGEIAALSSGPSMPWAHKLRRRPCTVADVDMAKCQFTGRPRPPFCDAGSCFVSTRGFHFRTSEFLESLSEFDRG